MQMSGKGPKIWEELTGRAYAQKSNIAIVLDNVVYSAPGVFQSGQFRVVDVRYQVLSKSRKPKIWPTCLSGSDFLQLPTLSNQEVVGPSLGERLLINGTERLFWDCLSYRFG